MVDSWNPELYAKFARERSQPFFDLLGEIEPVPGGSAVDLGCGSGELTTHLRDQAQLAYVRGLDSSLEMLSKSKLYQTPDSLEFQHASIENWTAPRPFDIVFSNAALHWCADHKQLLKKISECLEPHGQLAIQMPVNHDYPAHTVAMTMAGEKHWRERLCASLSDFASEILTPADYATTLFDLGFSQQKVFVRVYGHVLESRDAVIAWVQGTTLTRFQSLLAPLNYEEFVREYRERLFQRLPNDRPFFYPFKSLFLIARK